MQIVVASNNLGKIKEYQQLLKPFNIDVLTMNDVNVHGEADETGKNFKENSLLKASYVKKYTNLPIIADDSGLIIEELPNLLGVYSARFLGHETPYKIKRAKILELLENKNRAAYFECCITLLNYDDKVHQFQGRINGKIASQESGVNGFGYDAIFIPNGYSKTFAELDEKEKNSISHRGIAVKKLMEFLKENYNENTINK